MAPKLTENTISTSGDASITFHSMFQVHQRVNHMAKDSRQTDPKEQSFHLKSPLKNCPHLVSTYTLFR